MMRLRKIGLVMGCAALGTAIYVITGLGMAEAGLSCPLVTSDTSFSTTGLSTDCTSGSTLCTTKSGVSYDSTNNVLRIPPNGGNFQAPAGAAITKNVFYAAAGDFDHDGWDDFVAADNSDQIYIMRNQTITCGKTASGTAASNPAYYPCSGPTPATNVIASTDVWWNTLTNVRNSSFQTSNSVDSTGPESGANCNNATDDDGDGLVNDGCPAVNTNAGGENAATQCNDALDQDGDGLVNDGCPRVGTVSESGAQCLNAIDDDPANDSAVPANRRINDGCPAYTGNENNLAFPATPCANATDDDGDGKVNDGCPTAGSAASAMPLKVSAPAPATSDDHTPMIGGDFDGDGWQDFVELSYTYNVTGSDMWPTAARLFLNTKNCHKSTDPANQWTPCGIGTSCAGATNGACTGAGLTNGTAISESAMSCLNSATTANCPYNFATFATYDLKTGAATSAASTNTTTPATTTPGDFGPINHAGTNMAAVDWDGDGDLDLLYGHSASTSCPGSLCSTTTQQFHVGIDVWLNDCSAHYVGATTSCAGYIPRFTHSTTGETMTAPAAAGQNAAGVLIPSTAHNNNTIFTNAKLGFDVDTANLPVFAYEDVDKDGKRDLVLGSPGCCQTAGNETKRLRIFKGTGTGTNTSCPGAATAPCSFNHVLDTTTPISLSTSDATHPGFEGSFTGMYVFDFSLDGYPDLITASDNAGYGANMGGRTRYWKNTGSSAKPFGLNWPGCGTINGTCNPDPTTKITEHVAPYIDFDQTFLIDYDHDPQNTKDPVITDGNTTNTFFIFPNRATATTYAGCGTVSSGTLAAPAAEATVNGACITPTATVPNNTGINWFLSNDGGASWSLACLQLSTGFTPALDANGQCCVTFSDITGRNIQWKAELDSSVSANDLDAAINCTNPVATSKCGVGAPNGCGVTGSDTPTIQSVAANYTYTTAQQHYKAGVIVSDGVTYTGSFTQPGDRGHLYAISADFGTNYFDVSTTLDSQATRNLYTAPALSGTGTPLALSVANASNATLKAQIGVTTPGAAGTTEATNVLTWFLGARFGVYNSGTAESKFGAVVDSTPAIIQKPFRPGFYTYLSSSDRTLYDNFSTTQQNRIPLVLFGAMDGVVHAIYAISTNMAASGGDARNGLEAWGYVPPYVAGVMRGDWAASCPAGVCTSKNRTITSYPDGSPTLADFKTSGGTIATAAVIGDGNGGSEVTALNVTQTVTRTSSTTNTVQGPTLLWSAQPGASSAGYATSKPAIARVKIGGAEKFIVIAGTGINNTDNTKGKIVIGYNLETGAELWKFEMNCALTSDITIFETDDIGEDGSPTIDGYIDRAVFADQCGNVYKINPAQDLSAATPALWMGNDNASYGSTANSLGPSNGVTRRALFKTSSQLAGAGDSGERPITNTIGARADSTTDMVLFFGTGGVETFDISKQNAFFAIYAKDGTLRAGTAGKILGTCSNGKCQKFYGGVVVSTDTVYLVRSQDAVIGGVGLCDLGATELDAYGLNTLSSSFTVTQVAGSPIAASAGPLYGDAGALYFATVSGHIERVGTPRAATAGADSAGGSMNNSGSPEFANGSSPFTLIGWRVVL